MEHLNENLENFGKIISIYFTDESNIIFDMENIKFKLNVKGDCCSESWFETFDNLNSLKDEIILYYTTNFIEMEHSNRQDVDQNREYTFTLKSGRTFKIIDRNSSNGYYSSYISIKILNNFWNSNIISNSKVVIITGLPGSGKSTYMKNNYQKYVNFDDFIFDIFFEFKLIQALSTNQKIVINDPRLTTYSKFVDIYEKILSKVKSTDNIKIILFKNDLDKCKMNITNTYGIVSMHNEYNIFFTKLNELKSKYYILDVYIK